MNLGKYALRDGRFEVNMTSSSDPSKWRMNLFSKEEYSQETDRLKAGIVVRIYHKEYEAYLMYDEENNRLDLCSPDDLSDFSTFTLWEIEREERFTGGIISWTESVLIRHLSSKKYITMDPKKMITRPVDSPLIRTETIGNMQTNPSQFKKFGNSSWGLTKDSFMGKEKKQSGSSWGSLKDRMSPMTPTTPIETKKSAAWNFLKTKKSVMDQSKKGWGSIKEISLDGRKKSVNSVSGWNSVKEKTNSSGTEQKSGWGNLRSRFVETIDSVDLLLSSTHKTSWQMLNVQKNSNLLSFESYVRFFDIKQQTWVHMEKNLKEKKKITYKAESQLKMNEEDVFSIKKVPMNEVRNVLVIHSLTKPIERFLNLVSFSIFNILSLRKELLMLSLKMISFQFKILFQN
jgi:hypothetical protein